LPVSFFAQNQKEVIELSPPIWYRNYLGQSIQIADLKEKLSSEKFEKFFDTLLLSQEAKLFGLARAIGKNNSFFYQEHRYIEN
jgi:hypothetical protein